MKTVGTVCSRFYLSRHKGNSWIIKYPALSVPLFFRSLLLLFTLAPIIRNAARNQGRSAAFYFCTLPLCVCVWIMRAWCYSCARGRKKYQNANSTHSLTRPALTSSSRVNCCCQHTHSAEKINAFTAFLSQHTAPTVYARSLFKHQIDKTMGYNKKQNTKTGILIISAEALL